MSSEQFIIIQVRVNTNGEVSPVRLRALVDTGSNTSLLRSDRAPENIFEGCTLVGSRDVVFIDNRTTVREYNVNSIDLVASDGLVFCVSDVNIGVADIVSVIPHSEEVDFDVLLGTNILSRMVVTITPDMGINLTTTVSDSMEGKANCERLATRVVEAGEDGLGPILFIKTNIGIMMIDSGNQTSTFCTKTSKLCKSGKRDLKMAIAGEDDDVVLRVDMEKRDVPHSFKSLDKWGPFDTGGNIGLKTLVENDMGIYWILDFRKHRVYVATM